MEAKLTSVRENPLLDRRELEVELEHEGEPTPSMEDLKDRLAAENDIDPENIEIETINTKFGNQESVATVKVLEEFEYDEELETDAKEELEEEEVSSAEVAEYEEIVSGTITDAKEKLKEMDDPDYQAALEAEKANKNRTTLIDWLEGQ